MTPAPERRPGSEGWLLSGDLGYLDGDDYLWIVGRQKEMVIRGGHNVVPGEVEAALFDHPAVAEAAVAGIPHPVLGEDVAAWVVLREPTDPDALRAFLADRLADYKVPRRITVLDAPAAQRERQGPQVPSGRRSRNRGAHREPDLLHLLTFDEIGGVRRGHTQPPVDRSHNPLDP